jgi:cytochrome c oxidase cbb3-type subunit 3
VNGAQPSRLQKPKEGQRNSKVQGRRKMLNRAALSVWSVMNARRSRVMPTALLAIGVSIGVGALTPAATEPAGAPKAGEVEEDYGEYVARPDELASFAVNDIVKSLRLNRAAMELGRTVYDKSCASCHGADLKGLRDQHTPDLTDSEWRFSGDDLASGGWTKFPSDLEWTVRYGVRSEHPYARGTEVRMLAFDPKYRTEEDTKDWGDKEYLNSAEIDDVVEYVLQISGQRADRVKAARGKALFNNNAKGNCVDCHGSDGSGIDTFGSANLTRRQSYLYGSDRETIRETIVKGRRSTMPAFGESLKPEELKAVTVFVFSHAALPPPRVAQPGKKGRR